MDVVAGILVPSRVMRMPASPHESVRRELGEPGSPRTSWDRGASLALNCGGGMDSVLVKPLIQYFEFLANTAKLNTH